MSAAADKIRLWRERPDAFVRDCFGAEPDPWQDDVLRAFPHEQRMAMKCCKGPGKTTLLSWIAWNFLLTRPHPKIAATAISKDNLDDNLWTEMAKWQKRSPLLSAKFEWTKTRIYMREHPETWWMSARSFSRSADPAQQADTLAGLHSDFLLFLIDESGGVPSSVVAAAEAGLANADPGSGCEAHLIQAGNPTHLEGPLYDACTKARRLWHVTEISADPDDPKRTPRVSAEWARQQIELWGADNPWVLVNVFGRFPPASINALIGPDEVRDAMARHYREPDYDFAAKVMGVDVAREGDDASTIYSRQGLVVWKPLVLRNVDGNFGAGVVDRRWREFDADACFVDGTGGWGYPWIDALKTFNRNAIAVKFSGEPIDRQYFNKRTEMYMLAVNWIKGGGALPDVPELVGDLTQTTYTFKNDRLLLEPKEAIKLKLGRSPDHGDGLALTFAFPVQPRSKARAGGKRPHDYDPYA